MAAASRFHRHSHRDHGHHDGHAGREDDIERATKKRIATVALVVKAFDQTVKSLVRVGMSKDDAIEVASEMLNIEMPSNGGGH